MPILTLQQLTMRFGGLTAVNKVDLSVDEGQIFSVIGPNGAGKTTVFNTITGIYEPTEGEILFQGKRFAKPVTRGGVLLCLLIGLGTAVGTLLIAVNVDKLWRATVNLNFGGGTEAFSYAHAGQSARDYLAGKLLLSKNPRNQRWSVTTAGGETRLDGYLGLRPDSWKTRESADALRQDLLLAMAMPADQRRLVADKEHWILRTPERVLARYDSREEGERRLAELVDVAHGQAAMQRTVWIALLCGFAIGSAGTYAVWNRSRRTPDVISHGGIARTFQNIRLFQNMTVIENVLVGSDQDDRTWVLSMMLQTPPVRRAERLGMQKAEELLSFVGLRGRGDLLARNLPYGDQRRLEIARALATGPKLLLLDEPAAGMNPSESVDLMELIRKIRTSGVTVLLIEHHMHLVMGISDRIAVLDYGCKIAEGTPAEIKANPRVIEAYLGKEDVS